MRSSTVRRRACYGERFRRVLVNDMMGKHLSLFAATQRHSQSFEGRAVARVDLYQCRIERPVLMLGARIFCGRECLDRLKAPLCPWNCCARIFSASSSQGDCSFASAS